MNFSEFNESLESPLFEKKGETPECPEGYKWNNKLGKCEPKVKQKKRHENPGDKHRSLIGNFNVFGATGMNGDEDLGEDITMKGDKFHFNQYLQTGSHFATGMNGDEDLGQDITMKGEKFHYNQ